MIEFMLLAAPRSGTTWAANWLTTDATLCLHDPLLKWTTDELMTLESPKRLGVSCTGLALFPEWVNDHPARKVILHRPLHEVDESLVNIGMTPISEHWDGVLDKIRGMHLDWSVLFDIRGAKHVHEYLLDLPFDPERWALLRELNVQPHFEGLTMNREATSRLMNELRAH